MLIESIDMSTSSLLPLLSIVGPTATGKTDIAFLIAQKVIERKLASGIDIISADSRQVYTGLEILTGADVPAHLHQKDTGDLAYDFYSTDDQSIRLHGVSIIKPNGEWSVALFHKLVENILAVAQKNNRLVLLVGGTGLYHQFSLDMKKGQYVAPDEKWRIEAEDLSLENLQQLLQEASAERWERMNNSDRNNPRRLVRAIEVARAVGNSDLEMSPTSARPRHLYLGLQRDFSEIEERIKLRIEHRLQAGVTEEIKKITQLPETTTDALSATGAQEIIELLKQNISEVETRQLWYLRERQYAKRQLTWFKKQQDIKWFTPDASKSIIQFVVTELS